VLIAVDETAYLESQLLSTTRRIVLFRHGDDRLSGGYLYSRLLLSNERDLLERRLCRQLLRTMQVAFANDRVVVTRLPQNEGNRSALQTPDLISWERCNGSKFEALVCLKNRSATARALICPLKATSWSRSNVDRSSGGLLGFPSFCL
jgi:hypothetical protein